MDRHELKEILKEAFEESAHFTTHEAHHEWIQARIDNQKERNAMFHAVTLSVVQWSVVGLLSYLVVWAKTKYFP